MSIVKYAPIVHIHHNSLIPPLFTQFLTYVFIFSTSVLTSKIITILLVINTWEGKSNVKYQNWFVYLQNKKTKQSKNIN